MSTEQTTEVDETTDTSAPAPIVTDQTLEEQLKAARSIMEAAQGGSHGDDDGGDIVMGTPSPSPKKKGKKKSQQSAQPPAPTIPAKVKKMLGDTERYRFYKIDKLGNASLVGDYNEQSLKLTNNDVELFIQMYLVHEFGSGGYLVKVLNDKGALLREKPYSVLAASGSKPAEHGQSGGGMFEQGLVNTTTEELRRLQKEMREQDLRDREKLETANREMQANILSMQKGGDNSSSSMMMIMMMQSQQQAAQAAADRRREDMRREQMELQARIAAASAPPPMLPPPAPPAPDPMAQFAAMATLMKSFIPDKPDVSAETLMLREQVRELRENLKPPMGIEDIFDQVDKLDERAQRRYGSNDSTAADMVKGFMDNFAENMEALKSVITAGGSSKPKQLGAGSEQPKPDPEALPDGFIELIMELDEADDDLTRINVVLRVVQLFANCGTRKYEMIANQVITQISGNNKKPVMYMLKQILEECTNRKMIEEQSSIATYKAFDRHFEQVYETVTGKSVEKPEPAQEQHESVVTSAPVPQAVAEPVVPTPQPSEVAGVTQG